MAKIECLLAMLATTAAQPSQCVLCYTCGGSYPNVITRVRSETWEEYSSDCGAPLSQRTDDAEVCCSDSSMAAVSFAAEKTPKSPKADAPVFTKATAAKAANVSVPAECVVCYTCGGGFTERKATLISQQWLEFGSSCAGDAPSQTSDNAYVCCLPSSQDHLVHVL